MTGGSSEPLEFISFELIEIEQCLIPFGLAGESCADEVDEQFHLQRAAMRYWVNSQQLKRR